MTGKKPEPTPRPTEGVEVNRRHAGVTKKAAIKRKGLKRKATKRKATKRK